MPSTVRLSTIGFTKKSAEEFFRLLREAGVRRVLDVRLNNVSQLAGFAKRDDLEFFLREVAGIEYLHMEALAPTQELIEAARKRKDRAALETGYRKLIRERQVEKLVSPELLDGACLLCSEDRPEQCHRTILAEYLAGRFPGVRIQHLV